MSQQDTDESQASAELTLLWHTSPLVVAIDGPSGSGKSSVSKELAVRARLSYLDTGAMYRALTWNCLHQSVDLQDTGAIERLARQTKIDISTDPRALHVRVDERDVSQEIREPRISLAVSAIASVAGARAELIRRQRELIMEAQERIVVEGRDITSVVAPDAQARLLLTASQTARVRRRAAQLGQSHSEPTLRAQVVDRDAKDMNTVDFMHAGPGVISVDSSEMDFEQTVQHIVLAVVAALRDET